ncbi:hypothetical protein MMC13_000664 [Lambiella insularis]|nr:hypothetical protein [Lambiella insularis]
MSSSEIPTKVDDDSGPEFTFDTQDKNSSNPDTRAPPYAFRATPRMQHNKPKPEYLDQDDSGDFDPASETAQSKSASKRKRPAVLQSTSSRLKKRRGPTVSDLESSVIVDKESHLEKSSSPIDQVLSSINTENTEGEQHRSIANRRFAVLRTRRARRAELEQNAASVPPLDSSSTESGGDVQHKDALLGQGSLPSQQSRERVEAAKSRTKFSYYVDSPIGAIRGASLYRDSKQAMMQGGKFVPKKWESAIRPCIPCIIDHKVCSLLEQPLTPVCTRCKELKRECPLEEPSSRQYLALPAPEGLITKTIRTRLAHPVEFNCDASADNACDWCADPSYGVEGFEELAVKVLDFKNEQGYVEIEGGHNPDGTSPSNMCIRCTTERLMITACKRHSLVQFETRERGATCALCSKDAEWKCLKGDTSDSQEIRCGLEVCDPCACRLIDNQGNLTEVITDMEADHSLTRKGIRADINFLRSDGHLLNRTRRF